jgi:1-deoxy-D-xylulose-5-phosphate reductoisomerase
VTAFERPSPLRGSPPRTPSGPRGVAVLGSTGSIGVSTLEVVAAFPHRFRVTAIAAGRNLALVREQVRRFRPRLVSVARAEDADALRAELAAEGGRAPQVLAGEEGAVAVASHAPAQVVVSAMVGAVGLRPTLAAIKRGVRVAVANKEPLVIAGHLCREEARRSGAVLFPVDSEHSAIFQVLRGQRAEEISRIFLTGSGGSCRLVADLGAVTVEQALSHPNWRMGAKVTIDSATLMNKGLEVIEARWLFDLPAERIEVLIHGESVVHSLVELVDGSVLAQLAVPDMRLPIGYALSFPERLPLDELDAKLQRLDLCRLGRLSFAAPDRDRFPCLRLAYDALARGGTAPAVLSAANEVAVAAFLRGALRFDQIPRVVEETLSAHAVGGGETLEQLLEADAWARAEAERLAP